MRAVIQRVSKASVRVEGETIGKINKGLLVLLGIGADDDDVDLNYMVDKILGLRVFEDYKGKMNESVMDINGEILIVSQFTIYGDVRKGKRPSFSASAHTDKAEDLYNRFIQKCKTMGIIVSEGIFGANMEVALINDGPVTILIDSKKRF